MKRTIINLILNIFLLVFWSIVGISKAVTEPSWMCLVYGGLMMICFVTVIDEVCHVARLAKTRNTEGEEKMKK